MSIPSLKDRIGKLREAFIARLPEQIEEIATLYRRLLEGAERADWIELHRLVHSLKGSSASFGMLELTREASGAEGEAKRVLDGGPGALAAPTRTLGHNIAALHHFVHGGAVEPPPEAVRRCGFQLPAESAGKDTLPVVYLCDDDRLQGEHLAMQLACFGYLVEVFTDTQSLAEAIIARRPQAVLMDIIFPNDADGGLNLLAGLQGRVEPPIPCIFFSCRGDFDARLKAVQAGGAAYFAKPVGLHDLVGTLDKLTNRREAEPYRILVVDDEPEVSQYHAVILEDAGMEPLVVNRPEEVLARIGQFNPDLVLMDMYMPSCTGGELARVIRQIPDFVSLPIVYLSSETDEVRQYSALRVGADGFLTKPIEPERLIAEVMVRAERMRILRGLMLRDSLTGLFNHTTIKQMLKNALDCAERTGKPVSFVMIDVDAFKSVNDRFGHPVGDQVLIALSRLLRQRLRRSDLVGRYGGEEFAIVMTGAGTRKPWRWSRPCGKTSRGCNSMSGRRTSVAPSAPGSPPRPRCWMPSP